nr:unnamed protein product [Callosobruchus analis]
MAVFPRVREKSRNYSPLPFQLFFRISLLT